MELTSEIMSVLEGLSLSERTIVTDMIKTGDLNSLDHLYSIDYKEIPVSIDQFMSDPHYLGSLYDNGKLIYPYWRTFMHDFFHKNPDKAFEIAFSGAIGIGKSTIAGGMMTYLIYRTLCLKNPREFYRLTGNSPIVFVVMNLTLDLAYEGLYTLIVENIRNSPWFKERVDIRGKYDYIIEFENGISLIAGSNTQHVIGKNVLGAILDEVNFSRAPKGSKNSVMDMYRSIKRRMESRFMKAGNIPGMIGLISSKNDENSFLENYIGANRFNKKVWVVDKPVYEIKPPETYLGPTFKVAVGDKTRDSFVIETEEDQCRAITNKQTIINIPVEYKGAFQSDINESLKEIAGISVTSSSKLIAYPGKILTCVDNSRRSPVMGETIYLSLDGDESIMDYLEDLNILRRDVRRPRFIHTDIALKGDSLGLAVVHVSRQKLIDRTNIDGRLVSFSEPVFDVDLLLRIRATQGSEIPLYRVREFIIWLKRNIYKSIPKVTYDGFQSADSIQIMQTAGFDSGLLSVDRTDIPYLNLRSSILDNRLTMYHHQILLDELMDLEYDRTHHKVDHPELTIDNRPGSKDVADALCVSYDTPLFLLSGKSMTIQELYESGHREEWVLSCDTENKKLVPVRIEEVVKKSVVPDYLLRITLDNGESFSVTEDHLILTREGTYERAQDLIVGSSLMPFTRGTWTRNSDTYRTVIDPYTFKSKKIYKLVVDELKFEEYDAVDITKDCSAFKVIHHVDHDKSNDNPTNLQPMTSRVHRKLHGDILRRYNQSASHRVRASVVGKSRGFKVNVWSVPEYSARVKAISSELMTTYNKSQQHRERLSTLWKSGHYDHTIKRGSESNLSHREVIEQSIRTKRETGVLDNYSKSMTSMNKDEVIKSKQKFGKIIRIYRIVRENSNLFDRECITLSGYESEICRLRMSGILNTHDTCSMKYEDLLMAGVPLTNHSITSIERVPNSNHVYDLRLATIHNFGLPAGVFIHNCGSVYNASTYYSSKSGKGSYDKSNKTLSNLEALKKYQTYSRQSVKSEDEPYGWVL